MQQKTISSAEVRLSKKGLPTPKKARAIARDTGRLVAASDGFMYNGATKEEIEVSRNRRRQTYAVLDAITTISELGISPQQWLSEAEDHQLHQFRLASLEAAAEWLAALKPAISKKLEL